MADEVTDVFQKVSFLHTHACPRSVAGMGESRGLKPMCLLLTQHLKENVARKTVSGQIAAGKLASKFQQAVAGVFGFRVDASQWQTGRAKEFEDWYLALHPLPKVGPVVCEPEVEEGVSLKAWPIQRTPPFDSQLASIDLFPRQSGADQPWEVDISLCCQPAPVEGVQLAVRCGRIRIDGGGARTGSIAERADYLKGAEIRGSHGKIAVTPGGDERNPSWVLNAGKHCIGILKVPEVFFFCKLYGLAPGTAVTVRFTVYFRDLEVSEADGASQSISFLFPRPPEGEKFSEAKKRILARLAQLALPNGDDGWAELCSDGRVFKKLDADSEA
jgi:hypothetical protein